MVLLPVLDRVTRAMLVRRGVESRFVETPIARVHVYDARGEGTAAPVVFLHGIAASSSTYAPTLARLRKKSRRVLAVDAPGHGLSSAPWVTLGPERLFEALSYVLDREIDAPALVVGNSLGGAMALRYAQQRPERVAGLVLTSPGGAPVDDPEERERFLRGFVLENVRDARDFLGRLHHAVPWYGPLVAPDIVRMFKNPSVRSILDALEPRHFFAPGELSSLAMPIQVLWGKSDRVIPPSCLAFFKANLPPHTIFEEPEGIGHSPHTEDPRRFAAFVLRGLERAS
jgi:pimeloyl-ACP methyl ester carboxylesterase